MEEEYSQKSSTSRYSFNSSVRALNRPPFFTDAKGNEIDSELVLISQSIQKLIDSLDKRNFEETQKNYKDFLKKHTNQEKIEVAIRKICEDLFKEVNRNLIIAGNYRASEPQKPTKNPDMILFELGKKRNKLAKIFEILSEIKYIQLPIFQKVKALIFEGIEKLGFSLKMREIQMRSVPNQLSFSKHDNIVRGLLGKWVTFNKITSNDAKNTGMIYSKIDCVDDFLFEVGAILKEQSKNITKNSGEDYILLIDYLVEFFGVLDDTRKQFKEDYSYSGWVMRQNDLSNKDMVGFLIGVLLETLNDMKLFNLNEKFMKKYGSLCKCLLRELTLQSKLADKREEDIYSVYECLMKIGLVNDAFDIAIQKQEFLILSKIYCLYNIRLPEIKQLMAQDENFLKLFIDFYLSFWKYHLQRRTLNSDLEIPEFRLFSDFTEFEPVIEQYFTANYPNLSWLLTLKKSIEKSSSTTYLQSLLKTLQKNEKSVRMRVLLCQYWKACVLLEENNVDFRFINSIIAIDHIQIKYTKEDEEMSLIGIINHIREGNFENTTIICQCLNLLRNYLNLWGQVQIFQDDPNELFFKILELSIKLDEKSVEEIIDLLKKDKDEERRHSLIIKLNFYYNFESFREIAKIMGHAEWEDAKQIFITPFAHDEAISDYLLYIFGYVNTYYEGVHTSK